MNKTTRRQFLSTLSLTAGATTLMATVPPTAWRSTEKTALTVGDVINLIVKTIPGAPLSQTVDTLKSGDLAQRVTGITSTMFPTIEVIERTIQAGSNMIIAHEPTFYNHTDDTSWLQQDDVYEYKRDLLKKNNIAVWRFHDYWHMHQPDGILAGVLETLGWQPYAVAGQANLLTMPEQPLSVIVQHAKKSLGIDAVRMVGHLAQPCSRVLLLPGAMGGKPQIAAIEATRPDVVMVGEIHEWETAEYIRDARRKGDRISLVVLGHALSEEPGMKWLVKWLQPKVGDVPVTHIPSQSPLSFA